MNKLSILVLSCLRYLSCRIGAHPLPQQACAKAHPTMPANGFQSFFYTYSAHFPPEFLQKVTRFPPEFIYIKHIFHPSFNTNLHIFHPSFDTKFHIFLKTVSIMPQKKCSYQPKRMLQRTHLGVNLIATLHNIAANASLY